MRDVDELDAKWPDFQLVARPDLIQPGLLQQIVLFQAPPDERQGERRRVDRNVHLGQQERQPADVVLVAVRKNYRSEVLAVLLQIGEVRRDDVHAEQFVLGEHHTGVNQDDIVAISQRERVHPELAEAAERNNLKFVVRHLSIYY